MNLSHLAAPHRNYLSATAKAMLNHNLLQYDESHLDYGCGRGGDVERLRSLGYSSTGYDPYYFPNPPSPADVITMSYVLNVIANIDERREALTKAWKLTKKHLIISANVRGNGINEGSFTAQGTFSKSYSHVELKAFVESTLGYEAIKISKDKFLVKRCGRTFEALHYEKILEEMKAIASQGWIPPNDAIVKGYCTDFKPRYIGKIDKSDNPDFPGRIRYYRLVSDSKQIPSKNSGMVRCRHICGGIDGEEMRKAIAALQRRNKILRMKFHCIEQSFLHEFTGCRKFHFLEDEIKIYP